MVCRVLWGSSNWYFDLLEVRCSIQLSYGRFFGKQRVINIA